MFFLLIISAVHRNPCYLPCCIGAEAHPVKSPVSGNREEELGKLKVKDFSINRIHQAHYTE